MVRGLIMTGISWMGRHSRIYKLNPWYENLLQSLDNIKVWINEKIAEQKAKENLVSVV